jgi:capsular polysaccharide biosynthesis protein
MTGTLSEPVQQQSRLKQEAAEPGVAALPPRGGPREFDRAATVWRDRKLILSFAALAAAIALLVSVLIPATYRSTATIRVAGQPVNGALSDAVTGSNNLAKQYAEIVGSPVVESVAAKMLHVSPSSLRGGISAGTVNDQNLISIDAQASSADAAARRANAVANSFINYIRAANARQARELVRNLANASQHSGPVPASVAQAAAAAQPTVVTAGVAQPGDKVAPKPALYTLIALVVGALVTAQVVILLRRRQSR